MATNVAAQDVTFLITDTKLYVQPVTLSARDNTKLLKYQNLVLKEQLTGININQKYEQKEQIIFNKIINNIINNT